MQPREHSSGEKREAALKCTKKDGKSEDINLNGQLAYMRQLESGGAWWSVRGYDVFEVTSADASQKPFNCLSMEILGDSLRRIRESRNEPITLTSLASIGIQMIDILDDMHNRFKLYHSDVHAGNWVFRADNRLVLIDYGYMRRLESTNRASELKEMVIALRWLIDMDNSYYAPKHIPSHKTIDDICPPGVVPKPLRDIIEYTYKLNESSGENIYSTIRQKFENILKDESYTDLQRNNVSAKSSALIYINLVSSLVIIFLF